MMRKSISRTLQSKSGLIFFAVLAIYNLLLGIYLSERLSCAFAYAAHILFTLCLAALTFCHQNTVCTYACNRVHCIICCSFCKCPQFYLMLQASANDDADNHCRATDVSGNF